MNLTFVNHASVLIEHKNISLITDPWLFGKAFNNSWDLISESKITSEDFKNIKNIWFSHEHPDHFNMPTLNQIPLDYRKQITIFFQQSKDHRVANKCKEMGFRRVIELDKDLTYELSKSFSIRCQPVGFYDSWIYLKVDGIKILNLNDCVINTRKQLEKLEKLLDGVDVLLTQYSYASKIGNKHDTQLRKEEARSVLEGVRLQTEILKPMFVIPFASMINYSHKDNLYMNDSMNSIRHTASYINANTDSLPIILYPGESWDCKSPRFNIPSIIKYESDYSKPITPYSNSTSTPLSVLKEQCDEYRNKIKKKNSMTLIKLLYLKKELIESKIYLRDLQSLITFDLINGIQESEFKWYEADIITDSDSLSFVFQFEYGADTLHVNGRFETAEGNISNFFNTFRIGTLNNNGRTVLDLFKIGIKKKLTMG